MQLPPFDELVKLAQSDPTRLENLRQQLVDTTISSAPQDIQRRLRGLQFQIDSQRQLASNPMSACIKISKMMHDRLFDLKEYIQPGDSAQASQQQEPAAEAAIIPFPVAAI